MRVGASTSYKGHTEITHSVDETVKGTTIVGQGVTIESSGTLSGEGTQIDSGNGRLSLKGKNGVNFTEANETHVTETTHSEDTLTVSGYVGNKWAETAKNAYEDTQDAVNGNGDAGKAAKSVASVGRAVKEIGKSGATAATFGFYGGVEIDKESSRSTQISGVTLGRGANFRSNGGMEYQSDQGDITLKGATVTNTGGDISFTVSSDKSINLLAVTDTIWSGTQTGYTDDKVNLETNIVGYYDLSGSHTQSSSGSNNTNRTVRNTVISNVNGTTTYTGNSLNLLGAESRATVQDLSGIQNLTIESQQDTGSRRDHSDSFSVNGSMGSTGVS
ncbi:hypothetical protein EB093_10030, partial [bacterium]|nr:hypothetical protein [bacterium]